MGIWFEGLSVRAFVVSLCQIDEASNSPKRSARWAFLAVGAAWVFMGIPEV